LPDWNETNGFVFDDFKRGWSEISTNFVVVDSLKGLANVNNKAELKKVLKSILLHQNPPVMTNTQQHDTKLLQEIEQFNQEEWAKLEDEREQHRLNLRQETTNKHKKQRDEKALLQKEKFSLENDKEKQLQENSLYVQQSKESTPRLEETNIRDEANKRQLEEKTQPEEDEKRQREEEEKRQQEEEEKRQREEEQKRQREEERHFEIEQEREHSRLRRIKENEE
jgi:hypothetical protein